jgi:hypothetical protein
LSDKSDGAAAYSPFIESLWMIFPATARNRSSKKKLAAAWKATTGKPTEDEVTAALSAWATSAQWTKDGGQFAPAADRWIRDRKWESEPEPERAASKHAGIAAPMFTGEEF